MTELDRVQVFPAVRPPQVEQARVVAYVRVSLEREDMISPQLQMQAITDYCRRHNYRVVRTLEDLDLSGRFWATRQVGAAVSMIEAGEADVLLVWRWSRVSRNRLDWATAVDRVERAGGRLESATEGFDTTTAVGRFARGMLAEFAAFESDRMGDIWREVRERRVRMGLTPNGLHQVGYRKVEGGRYVVDRRTGPIVAELYRRYNTGDGFPTLAAWLKTRRVESANPTMGAIRKKNRYAWHPSHLADVMDRGFAAGFVRHCGEQYHGSHTPLITLQEWATYLDRRAATRRHRRSEPWPTPLLKGLVYCRCGNVMRINQRSAENGARWSCYMGHDGTVGQRHMREERLHGLLFAWLVRIATDPDASSTARREAADHAAKHRLISRQLGRALQRATDPTERTRLEEAWHSAEQLAQFFDPADIATALVEDWHHLDDTYKRAEIGKLITRIAVHSGKKPASLTIYTPWGGSSSITAHTTKIEACTVVTDTNRWLTAGQAAALLDVHINTLRDWRHYGLLPRTRRQSDTTCLYAYTDLERISAYRAGRGCVDRVSLLRDLTATTSV